MYLAFSSFLQRTVVLVMQQFLYYTFLPSVLVRMDMLSLAWQILVLLILSFPLALQSENSTDATKFHRCYLAGHSFGCRFVCSS